MLTRKQVWPAFRRQLKTIVPMWIATGALSYAADSAVSYFHLPHIYNLYTPVVVVVVALLIAVVQLRRVNHSLDKERRAMEQRHAAEDALLFGGKKHASVS